MPLTTFAISTDFPDLYDIGISIVDEQACVCIYPTIPMESDEPQVRLYRNQTSQRVNSAVEPHTISCSGLASKEDISSNPDCYCHHFQLSRSSSAASLTVSCATTTSSMGRAAGNLLNSAPLTSLSKTAENLHCHMCIQQTHTRTYAGTQIHTRTNTHTYIHTRARTRTHARTHEHTYKHTYACTYTHTHTHILQYVGRYSYISNTRML